MSLVAVVNLWVETKLAEGTDTADTEKELLLETVFPITTIEVVSDGSVLPKVLRDVCIEEVELCTTYVNSPKTCMRLRPGNATLIVTQLPFSSRTGDAGIFMKS